MIKRLLFIFLMFLPLLSLSEQIDSVAVRLNNLLETKQSITTYKEKQIQELKNSLERKNLSLIEQYVINKDVYLEYKKFVTDSAIHYVLKNIEIANEVGAIDLKYETKMQLAWLYSTKGKYIEADAILQQIQTDKVPSYLLSTYYWTYCEFYSHYGSSNNEYTYYEQSTKYRDSLLMVLDHKSLQYEIEYAKELLYDYKLDEAKDLLKGLLQNTLDEDPSRALIAYLLGYAYKEENNIDMQKYYFSISAIADVSNSLRNNASFQELALAYYESGGIDQAYNYMQEAIENAVSCNVQYRTMKGYGFYSIINSAFQNKEQTQKSKLKKYLFLISILAIVLLITTAFVYLQMKRVSAMQKQLNYTNEELKKLNHDLKISNENLEESNHVKEEYIAQFFNQCSDYITRLEEYRKGLNAKAKNNQLKELFASLKSTTLIDDELKELYKNFDSVFLNIYPSYIEELNALLLPEEQVSPKSSELLNTELRIFALIRLGITDSVDIANFLRYSLRTVYNYRTKMRNKAAGSRKDFENQVKKIGAFSKSRFKENC